MKKRNKQYLREKEYLRLKKASDDNWDAQRNLGWIQLDEPLHTGYTAKLVLRSDIANREDAWIFQTIIDNYSSSSYAKRLRDLDFSKKDIKSYRIYGRPHVYSISENTYNSMNPQIKKWFQKLSFTSSWAGERYSCDVPNFFFEISIEKYYTTKIRIFDEVLQQEAAEIKATIEHKFYIENCRFYNGRRMRRILNNIQRNKSKMKMNHIIDSDEDYIFEDNYKNASGYW
jgi:hypothetical protein